MSSVSSFRAIVNLDENGELLCFCPYDEYLRGQCECRDQYDCPEAFVEITVLPKSKPSEQQLRDIEKVSKELKKADRQIKRADHRIKQGVNRLEEAIRKTRTRI